MSTLSTDDQVALHDLVHRYAAHVDDREPAAVAALFTEDGVLATASPPDDLDPTDEHAGRVAIEQVMSSLLDLDATFHAVTGEVFDLGTTARTATGRVACLAHHVTHRGGEPHDLLWAVTYRDAYTRTGEGWRFSRRLVHVQFVEARALRTARRSSR